MWFVSNIARSSCPYLDEFCLSSSNHTQNECCPSWSWHTLNKTRGHHPPSPNPLSILWSEKAGSQLFLGEEIHCRFKVGEAVRKQTEKDGTLSHLEGREIHPKSFVVFLDVKAALVPNMICQPRTDTTSGWFSLQACNNERKQTLFIGITVLIWNTVPPTSPCI